MKSQNSVATVDYEKKSSHYSVLVQAAYADGKFLFDERLLLEGFAEKMNIKPSDFAAIMKNPNLYPVEKTVSVQKRHMWLYEMFQIVFADHNIDDKERELVYNYATALGFSKKTSKDIVDRSIRL